MKGAQGHLGRLDKRLNVRKIEEPKTFQNFGTW